MIVGLSSLIGIFWIIFGFISFVEDDPNWLGFPIAMTGMLGVIIICEYIIYMMGGV
tara:strand:- start:24851 stop:25018 length:168 start_codon:yes stop_codon:yes gene_type:complete